MSLKRRPTTSDQPNREELFNMAVNAAKAGQRQPARMMFMKVLEQDARNIRAMLWMAKLSASDADKIKWLKRVLEIKPNNATAQEELAKLEHGSQARRNQMLLRSGVIAYVVVLMLVSALVLLTTLAQYS